jgi:Ca-activated chloride channel family protein
MGGDRFEPIIENDFRRVSEAPLSTFSIDVDTASYSKVRQFILQSNQLPPAGAVRTEELINYFDYADQPPAENDEHPFVARVEMAVCPWKPEHRLARIAIKGKEIAKEKRPASNLVFLVDTSGSMEEPNKLPLVKQGLQRLVEQLGDKDRVAIVVYAGSAGLVLDSTPATERATILRRINPMQSGGSTNGGEGIRLAYQVARDHFIAGGVNRVVLCSDGDFNVGTTSDDELVTLVETQAKGGIDITVLGFGMGNHNDSMMEKISGRGNGNYAFIDSQAEAQRVLVEQVSATLVTIARDVKLQVEFNPAEVAAYRLIGYENRRLANEDFKDDTKDAGEIGAGHAVTALYELIPASGNTEALAPTMDELRYQRSVDLTDASRTGEWMTVGIRYKKPDSDVSTPLSVPAKGDDKKFEDASEDFRFTASVAAFGMLLRKSEYAGNWTMSDVQRIASEAKGDDPHGLRGEFIAVVSKAAELRSSER